MCVGVIMYVFAADQSAYLVGGRRRKGNAYPMGGGRKMSSSAWRGCANKPAGREQAAPDHKKPGRNDKKNNPDNHNPNPNFCMCFTAAGRAAAAQKSAIRRGRRQERVNANRIGPISSLAVARASK